MINSKVSIVYVINTLDFFLSHRLPIALQAQSLGFDIHVVTARDSRVVRMFRLFVRMDLLTTLLDFLESG